MKKLHLNILLAGLIVISVGCKKVLDTSPYNAVTDAVSFATAERCALVLNGVYDAAQSTPYSTDNSTRGYPFGAANVEQGDCRGEDVVNIQAFFQVTYQATYNSTTANNVSMWNGLYLLINKANIGINGFQQASTKGVLSAAVASQYEAECRFLRAMAHHEALVMFARPYLDGKGTKLGVPWRDFAIASSSAVNSILATPRASVGEVYTKILADLDFAEANLPTTLFTYRATKAAAIALKMRVKLHMGDWDGVITEGAKLVPATVNPSSPTSVVSPIGAWVLTASPDGPFADNNSKESIFSIKNDALDAPSTNAALSRMFGAADLGGRGLVSISPVIYNNPGWLCDDKRRTLLTVAGTNSANGKSIFSTKYRQYSTWADYAPHIRYAEVLLMVAEAEARKATVVSARALDLLNVVRNRSLATPAAQAYTAASFVTKNDLVKAILLERRIELLCEGKRWDDIHRLAVDPDFGTGGIPAKAENGTAGLANFVCGAGYTPLWPAVEYSNYRFIWPIPSTEVTQNPIVEQNPLY